MSQNGRQGPQQHVKPLIGTNKTEKQKHGAGKAQQVARLRLCNPVYFKVGIGWVKGGIYLGRLLAQEKTNLLTLPLGLGDYPIRTAQDRTGQQHLHQP